MFALALPARAVAQELVPNRYVGQTVTAVHFLVSERVHSQELAYLVEQDIGQPYDPQAVQRTLALLYRLDQFDAVAARVREAEGGVELTFELQPRPRIARLRVLGARLASPTALRAALGKGAGDRWVQGDDTRLRQIAEEFYRARGLLEARVQVRVDRGRVGRIVTVDIDEGRRFRVGQITFAAAELAGVQHRQALEWLGAGLQPGRPYSEAALRKGAERLLKAYRRRGFVEARYLSALGGRRGGALPVEVQVDRDLGTVGLHFPVDSGRWVRAEFDVRGRRPATWTSGRLEQVIGLRSAHRVTASYAEDAARLLAEHLRSQGFYHARVVGSLASEPAPPSAPAEPAWRRPLATEQLVLSFDIDPGPRVTLSRDDIVVEGNAAVSRARIIQVLTEASPEVLGHRPLPWVVIGLNVYERYYTEREMRHAARVLEEYYRSHGYLEAGVGWEALVPPGPRGGAGRRVQLHLSVDEGAPCAVESLQVHGDLPGDFVEGWRERITGQPHNPADLEALAGEARALLAEQGHVDAHVGARGERSDDGSLIRLHLDVQRGPAVRFGKALVRGNRFTSPGLIRRDVRLPTASTFRPSELKAAQRRLLRTGLFDGVRMRAAQGSGRVRDVEVVVQERQRFSLAWGAGATWPDDGPRFSGEARLRNLDGLGLTIFVRGRVGVDWRLFSSALGTVAPEYRASMGIELPYLPAVPFRGTLTGVLNDERDEPTYRVSHSSLSLGLTTRDGGPATFRGYIEALARGVRRVDPAARLAGEFDEPSDTPMLDAQPIVLFGGSFLLDLRDDRFNPTRGLFFEASVDSTLADAISNSPAFGRVDARVQGLIPFLDNGFGLLIEAAGGLGWTYDGLLPPVEWRFRLGGTSTVRGFEPDAIGPTAQRPGVLEMLGLVHGDERTVPVGGDAFYRYSVQLQVPLGPRSAWRVVVFHDAGNALLYRSVPDGVDPSLARPLSWSVGVGVRRLTPIGPLRLDLAFRPDQFARIGEIPLGKWVQLHFAVGAL